MSVSQKTVPAQARRGATHYLSTLGRDGGCKRVRLRYARRYQVQWPGCGYQADLQQARSRAQKIADAEGQPVQLWDAEERGWLSPAVPKQHLCFNKQCRRPVSAAVFAISYRTGHCDHCGPVAEGA